MFLCVFYVFIMLHVFHNCCFPFSLKCEKTNGFLYFWWFDGCVFDIIVSYYFQRLFGDGHMLATPQMNIARVL